MFRQKKEVCFIGWRDKYRPAASGRKGQPMIMENKKLLRVIASALIIVVLSFMAGPNPSATAGSKNRGRSIIVYDGERPVYPGYPKLFDMVGKIDRLADRQVVIDDSLYRFAPSITYHTSIQGYTFRSSFHVGDVVGCLTNSKGEIKSMWLITQRLR